MNLNLITKKLIGECDLSLQILFLLTKTLLKNENDCKQTKFNFSGLFGPGLLCIDK